MKIIQPFTSAATKSEAYAELCTQLSALLDGESDVLANAANTVSLLYHLLPDVNWVGVYLLRGDELTLGPFQGKPACTRIKVGQGVCGTAAATRASVVVPDVNHFPGHIACDLASQSEIVVPLLNWGRLWGVLDVDSPVLSRFGEEDRDGLEAVAAILLSSISTNDLPDFEALAQNCEV
jgi:GAF domain-containing protein